MSERGSFITEYIYCDKCFDAVKSVFEKFKEGKYFNYSQVLGYYNEPNHIYSENLPILAGKIGALFRRGELFTFRTEIIPDIAEKICHPLRIAVLAEVGEEIFNINPKKEG